jgi:hypothetical protein
MIKKKNNIWDGMGRLLYNQFQLFLNLARERMTKTTNYDSIGSFNSIKVEGMKNK